MPNAEMIRIISELVLFDGLPEAERAALAAHLHEMSVPVNASLMSLEQPGEVVYLIVQGTVRVQAEQEDGSLVILAFLGAGDLVGEMSVIDRGGRSATVVTLEPCRLLWMDRRTFTEELQSSAQLSYNMVRILSRRLRMANEQVQALSTLDVAGRVARQLAAFASEYGLPTEDGVRIPLRLTQADLASTVGASRERVNQVLVALRQRGIIAIDDGQRFVVRDVAGLEQRYR